MASLGYELVLRTFPALVPWTVRFLVSTLVIRVVNRRIREEFIYGGKPFVGVCWHEYMLWVIHWMDLQPFTIMSSRSKDGEISTRVLRRLKGTIVRGSSSSGGMEALRQMTRVIRQKRIPGIFVADGPKGPRRVSKMGPVMAATLARVPIIPLGCAVRHEKRLRSWDQSSLPIPGTVMALGYGEPIDVPPRASGEVMEKIRKRVEEEMERLEERCRKAL